MAEAIQERARHLLSTSAQGLQLWALARLSQSVARARERFAAHGDRLPAEARAAAQRFGSQLWRRVTARFPGLADLLDDASPRASEPPPVAQLWQRTTLDPAASRPAYDVPALLRALRDPSAEVAAAAATALGVCTEPRTQLECQVALVEVLDNRDRYFSPLTRVAALQALVQRLDAPPSGTELERLLHAVRDVDAEVSMAAIAAVASHAPSRIALDHLFQVAFDETGFYLPMVRSAAKRALERAGLLSASSGPRAQG